MDAMSLGTMQFPAVLLTKRPSTSNVRALAAALPNISVGIASCSSTHFKGPSAHVNTSNTQNPQDSNAYHRDSYARQYVQALGIECSTRY
jgi:hypothetical protein